MTDVTDVTSDRAAEQSEAPAARDRLTARYGGTLDWAPPQWNETLDVLLRHRSVRAFTDREVSDEILRTIVAAAQSGATSSNLQLVSVVAVRDADTKAALAEVGGPRQKHIAHAPVVLVWLLDFARAAVLAEREGVELGGLDYLDAALVATFDAGIAAQNAVIAAESLGLGTVYLGSLRNDIARVAELLDLPPGIIPFVGLELGHPDPAENADIKPRLPQEIVLHHERYDRDRVSGDLDRYEATLADYYREYGLDPRWGARLLDRLSATAATATKRHFLREFFQRQGLELR